MQMPRVFAVSLVAVGLVLVPTVAGAQTSTPTTTPASGPVCTKGVTYTLLKSRKPGKVEVREDRANIRAFPGTDCPIYASAKRHARYKSTGRRARANNLVWVEIYNKTVGHAWVAAKLVRTVK